MSLESTKADDIAVVIEEAIVSGELAPGSVLRRVADVPYIESVAKAARRTFSGPAVWAPSDDSLDRLYERNQAEHRAIRQALAAGSVAGARELAHEHVMHSFELLTTILEHVGSDFAARS